VRLTMRHSLPSFMQADGAACPPANASVIEAFL
jgi:hypothetical protein